MLNKKNENKKMSLIELQLEKLITNSFKKVLVTCSKHGEQEALADIGTPEECVKCPLCELEKEIKEKREKKRLERKKSMDAKGVLKHHYKDTFNNYDFSQNQQLKEALKKSCTEKKNNIIFLFGEYGSGKTHLLTSAVKKHKQAMYIPFSWLILKVRATYKMSCNKTESEYLQSLCTVPFLAIDDIDSEPSTMETKRILSLIIKSRFERFLPTWVAGACNDSWIINNVNESCLEIISKCGKSYSLIKLEATYNK